MISERRRAANQANARQPTGPRTPGVEPSETELSHAANAPAQSGRKPVRLVLGADGVFKKINDEDNQS
jgi:hypothetical protein